MQATAGGADFQWAGQNTNPHSRISDCRKKDPCNAQTLTGHQKLRFVHLRGTTIRSVSSVHASHDGTATEPAWIVAMTLLVNPAFLMAAVLESNPLQSSKASGRLLTPGLRVRPRESPPIVYHVYQYRRNPASLLFVGSIFAHAYT